MQSEDRLSFRILRSAFCVFVLLAGCSPTTPDLSVGTKKTGLLDQHFTRAFFVIDDAGGDRVVLVNDPIDQPIPGPPGGPLPSVSISPIRQVFVAHLNWRAGNGTSPGSIAAANGALDWYVYGGPGPGQSMIHYRGLGFVRIEPNGSTAKVEIEDGSLDLVEKTGDLVDPLKSFTVNGTFQAALNPAQVKSVTDEVQAAEVSAKASSATVAPTTMPAADPTTVPALIPLVLPSTLPTSR